jgi:hypothetical protein
MWPRPKPWKKLVQKHLVTIRKVTSMGLRMTAQKKDDPSPLFSVDHRHYLTPRAERRKKTIRLPCFQGAESLCFDQPRELSLLPSGA